MRGKWLIINLLLLVLPFSLIGQYSNLIHYTVKDGLPSSTIYTTMQDSFGYMWMGTEAGLVRFDGAKFKVFTTLDGLPDNEVLGVLFDGHTQRLWIMTYSKQPCYYRAGKIYNAQTDSSLRVIKCRYGEFIHANKHNDKVFLFNGPLVYECANDTVKVLTELSSCLYVHQVSWWNDSTYDVLNDKGIVTHIIGRPMHIDPAGIHDTTEYGQWIGHTLVRSYIGKIIFYERGPKGGYKETSRVKVPDGYTVTMVIPDENGGYIFGVARHGVFSLDSTRTKIHQLWAGNSFNGVYIGAQGNLWITTGDDGVYILRRQKAINYTVETGLTNDNVTALSLDEDGKVLLGNTHGEVYKLMDSTLHHDELYVHTEGKVRRVLAADSLLFVIANDCSVTDKRLHTGFHIAAAAGGPKCVLRLKEKDVVLIGYAASLMQYDLKTGKHPELPCRKRIIDMAQHRDGRVFCASLDGIYIYASDTLAHIDSDDPRLTSRITSLSFSPDDILWIGTPSNGVMAYNGKKIIGHITPSKYLAYHGAICRKVLASERGELWVATNAGLNKINYHVNDTLVIDNILPLTTTDGLLSSDVNDILIIGDSLIYVATSGGLTVLNEHELLSSPRVPIYITSIRINDRDSAIHDAGYCLNYTQNNLKIEYVGISLPSAGYLRYQYRLLGSGNDRWTTTSNTSIEFRSLSAGDYTFEAVVLDKFGKRSENVARVRFQITPAFYMTIWFWALTFITVMIIGFYIIRGRFKRQQRQFEKEQSLNNKIIELEQQALKAQMNPHFIFNCLTAVQHFVNKEDLYSANMYLSNFAKLIRKTLDLSGEQYVSLDKEVAYLTNYIQLEKMRFQEKFSYKVTVADDIDEYSVQVPPMLLQPIIENAIRHGLRNKETDTGLLKIDFTKDGDKLICDVDDNGVGMKKAKELKTTMHVEYQSKGMSLTMSRIKAINMISEKKITIEIIDKHDDNNEASGTLIRLSFEQ